MDNGNLSTDWVINERLSPMPWQCGYLVLRSILMDLRWFSLLTRNKSAKKFLDLGCGRKPYRQIFPFTENYVGFDIDKNDSVDVTGVNWDLPFGENEFDAVICTQVLEHTARITETISEIRRVVKNDGLVFVSVPLVFPEHGAPYDYYRFTQYGLREIFRDFEVVKIIPQGGYFNTFFRMINLFLNYFPGSRIIFAPIFFLNNISAMILDTMALLVSMVNNKMKHAYESIYMAMPENYSIILRNRKSS